MRSMLSPESYARLGKHVSELQMVLANILSDAITEKYIPENDIRELAMLVHGSLSSSAGRAEDAPDAQTRERQIQSTIRFIQMGLGASLMRTETPSKSKKLKQTKARKRPT